MYPCLTHAGQHIKPYKYIQTASLDLLCNLLGSICSNYHMYIGMYTKYNYTEDRK